MNKKKKEKEELLQATRKSVHDSFVKTEDKPKPEPEPTKAEKAEATRVKEANREAIETLKAAKDLSEAFSSPNVKKTAKAAAAAISEGKTCHKCKSFGLDERKAGWCALKKRNTGRKHTCKKWEGK